MPEARTLPLPLPLRRSVAGQTPTPQREPYPMPVRGIAPEFDKWKERNVPKDSGYDYDLYAAFKSLRGADIEKSANGHGTDKFKRPNHPTFSNQSQYSTPEHEGGVWGKDGEGKDTYTPSPQMAVDEERMKELYKYMAEAEKNVKLVMPTTK